MGRIKNSGWGCGVIPEWHCGWKGGVICNMFHSRAYICRATKGGGRPHWTAVESFKERAVQKNCFDRGHVLLASAKGSYGKLEDFSPCPYDELLWPEGSETLPVVPWSVFHQIWKEKLPKLKIHNWCEDTCPKCFVLKNLFKFKADRWQWRPESSDDSDDVFFKQLFLQQ